MITFYHSADLDGFASGAIVKHKYPETEFYYINYGDEFPWHLLEGHDNAFMVDFSLPPEDMLRLIETIDLVWIDHHETAIEDAEKFGYQCKGIQKIGIAGCELTWEYLFPDIGMPFAIHLLGRYDVFDLKKDVVPFQYYMKSLGDTRPDRHNVWGDVLSGGYKFIQKALLKGRKIEEERTRADAEYCKAYSFETTFDGYKTIAINKGFTGSKIFDSVWDNTKYDIMLVFNWGKKGHWKVSLYSDRDDVHVGDIAKRYGGGGHKGAAGFMVKSNALSFLNI